MQGQAINRGALRMRAALAATLLVSAAPNVAARPAPPQPEPHPRTTAQLYFNGDILTMAGPTPGYVEALVAQGGKILFVGSLVEARRQVPGAVPRNLKGRTLLPGFIDGHGHVYLTSFFISMANVMPPPDGPGKDHAALVRTTRAWMTTDTGKLFIRTFGWVLANGYDHALMPEGEPPTVEVLDRITTEYPVLMLHQSGHIASVNHKGLEVAGFSRSTPDPAGGVIRRTADGSPNGVIEESALNAVAGLILPKADAAIDALVIERGQQLYLANGYTTGEEARAFPNITTALERATQGGQFQFKAGDTTLYFAADTARFLSRATAGGERLPDPLVPLPRQIAHDDLQNYKIKYGGVSGQIDHAFGNGGTLTSITAYRTSSLLGSVDEDFTPNRFAATNIAAEDTKHFSQEIRYASDTSGDFDYLIGLYYLDQQVKGTGAAFAFAPALNPAAPAIFVNVRHDSKVDSSTLAGFLHANYRPAEKVEITLGARLTREKKSIDYKIAAQTAPEALANARIIDGGGRTLMPGLIDVHTHLLYTVVPLTAGAGRDPNQADGRGRSSLVL